MYTEEEQQRNREWLLMLSKTLSEKGGVIMGVEGVDSYTFKYKNGLFQVKDEDFPDMINIFGLSFVLSRFVCPEITEQIQELFGLSSVISRFVCPEMTEKQIEQKIQYLEQSIKTRLKQELKKRLKNQRRAWRKKQAKKLATLPMCCYCLDVVEHDRHTLQCGHSFHKQCFKSDQEYRQKHQQKTSCPMCRADV